MITGMICIGLILIGTALKNTQHELGARISTDVLGQDGFLAWATAILAIGAIGYIPGLKPASRYLLLLIGVVMVVRNGGIFANAQAALQSASAMGPAPSIPSPLLGSSSNQSSSGSGSSGSGSASSGSSSSSDSGIAGTGVTWSEAAEIAAVVAL